MYKYEDKNGAENREFDAYGSIFVFSNVFDSLIV